MPIHFGFTYTIAKANLAERFIIFCEASEYLRGTNGYIIVQGLLASGGQLVAHCDQESKALITLSLAQGTILGDEILIQHFNLSDFQNQVHSKTDA